MIPLDVPLSAIDFEDETFRISEGLDLELMTASLQAVGQIQPAVLLPRAGNAGHRIVCGFRRLHGLRRLGRENALACLLNPAECGTLEAFLKALWDNLSHRQLSPLEAARVLHTLKMGCGVDEGVLVERFLPLLGLSPHRNVLESFIRLHALVPELRQLLASGRVTISTAERLARFTPGDQRTVAPVLEKARFSAALQRELLGLAEDIAAMSGVTPAQVLTQPGVVSITEDAGLSAFQKGEKIHALLYGVRNPRLARARAAFAAEKAALGLPGTVRLSPDPFFESPRLRVEFDAASARDLRESIQALERSCRNAALDRLFSIT
jgi:hypothetical protein